MQSRQHWDPTRYQRNAAFVAQLGLPLLELLNPQPGEDILDLGCGDGALTERLAQRGARVIGVDRSPQQVAATRERGLTAHVRDATDLGFEDAFDAVFSNATLHWIQDADGVLRAVRRALRPGGRFVGEMGGKDNCATVRTALHRGLWRRGVDPLAVDPWYFPTVDEYSDRLGAVGFTVVTIELVPRPTVLPGDLGNWLDTFAEDFLRSVPDPLVLKEEVRQELKDDLCDEDGQWTVDYVRLRFFASLSA